ncbi:FliM/FliN family flagellar motor C-terminal domain-containing protein [Sulfitobacter sp. HNIBRBA3233]|uniref:FliM/FliN family flagellar motor C-terminal domain-containing protein n=1 Tax=Sulfitobacter marinivivus TaxID=3158558 RepID=UPI0032DE3DCF
MSAKKITSLVRRKAEAGRESYAARAMTLGRALRLTAARTADAHLDLALSVIGLTQSLRDGASLEKSLQQTSLLLLMEGSGGRAALAVLSPELVTALIQQQTMGRITAPPEGQEPRPHTATDAALCAPFVEALLRQSAEMPEKADDRALVAGYRFGLWAGSPREACLSLDAPEYQSYTLTLDLAGGTVSGTLDLVLPPPPPAQPAPPEDDALPDAGAVPTFSQNVLGLNAELTVALTQLTLPLNRISGWQVGDFVALDVTSLGQSLVLDANGRMISRGTLGQLDGCRAVQLEQRQQPHIHPRRRASDRDGLDLPDVTAGDAAGRPEPPAKRGADPFGDLDAMPDMSDLEMPQDDAGVPAGRKGPAHAGGVERRRQASA